MFDLRQLEQAHAIVGAAMPPTPAPPGTILISCLGMDFWISGRNSAGHPLS